MLLCLKRVPLGSSPSLPSYTWRASSGARSCPRPTQLEHKAHANLVWSEVAPETLQVICGFHAEAVPPGPAVWLAFPGCVGQDGSPAPWRRCPFAFSCHSSSAPFCRNSAGVRHLCRQIIQGFSPGLSSVTQGRWEFGEA